MEEGKERVFSPFVTSSSSFVTSGKSSNCTARLRARCARLRQLAEKYSPGRPVFGCGTS